MTLAVAAAFLVILASWAGVARPAPSELEASALASTAGGALDRIAYQSNQVHGFTSDIWVINEDGTGATQLTFSTFDEVEPAFSADGQRIAFASNQNGNFDIYVMNDDGTGVVQLTHDSSEERFPSFSPDGTQIVFESDRDDDFDIYVMDATPGASITRLTGSSGDDGVSDHQPEFSRDGGRVVFFRSDFLVGENAIYALDLLSGTVTKLSHGDLQANGFPTFSPDGTRVAFQGFLGSQPPTFGDDIWLVDADGSGGDFNVTASEGVQDGSPSYDLDEDRIAFSSNLNGRDEFDTNIYLVNADGSGITRVTPDDFHSSFITNPSFGPPADPTSKEDCKNGGWAAFGFANQGLCIQFVNTGKDSR